MNELNITVESGKTRRLKTAGKWNEKDILVTGTGGTEDLNDPLTEQEALIEELKAELQGKAAGGGNTPSARALVRRGIGYIDTGIDGANSNLRIEIRYEFLTMPTTYFNLVYAYVDESTNSTRIIYNKHSVVYACLNSTPSSSLSHTLTRYVNVVYTDILQPANSTTFAYKTNGVQTTKARTSGAALVGKSIRLFAASTTNDNVSLKVYYLKIFDGDTLVRDFIPYVAPSGECGLYDKVTEQFFGNAGGGTFEVEV